MSKNENQISLKDLVHQLEGFSVDFYRDCLLKTNQFSTKFILQQVIKAQQEQQKEMVELINLLGDEQVDARYLDNIIDNFSKKYVDGQFELESLNFVEATHLAIILMNYTIEKYKILMEYSLSRESKSSLHNIFKIKQKQLAELEKEYEKRRYK